MDKLKEIADALDIDVAALSDINIQSEEDIMCVMAFYLCLFVAILIRLLVAIFTRR